MHFVSWKEVAYKGNACSTKAQWENLLLPLIEQYSFLEFRQRDINRIFLCLSKDSLSLNYSPKIWKMLIDCCLVNRSLDLANKINKFCEKLFDVDLLLSRANLYLDQGEPEKARDVVNRATKLKSCTSSLQCLFSLVLVNSYLDEGKVQKVKKSVHLLEDKSFDDLKQNEQSVVCFKLARIFFFLGEDLKAAAYFQKSAEIHEILDNWYEAARSYFNAAVCCDNESIKNFNSFNKYSEEKSVHEYFRDKAECLMDISIKLSKKYDFKSIIQSSLNFIAVRKSNVTSPAKAIELFREAEKFYSEKDTSYDVLHNLAMQVELYLNMGQWHKAEKKFIQLDNRFSNVNNHQILDKFSKLRFEIKWSKRMYDEAYQELLGYIKTLSNKEKVSLERNQLINVFYQYSIMIGKLGATNQSDPGIVSLNKKLNTICTDKSYRIDYLGSNFLSQFQDSYEYLNDSRLNTEPGSHFRLQSLYYMLFCIFREELLMPYKQEVLEKLERELKISEKSVFQYALNYFKALFSLREGNLEDVIKYFKLSSRCSTAPSEKVLFISNILSELQCNQVKGLSQTQMSIIESLGSIYFPLGLRKEFQNYLG